jgi:hypothetical protein
MCFEGLLCVIYSKTENPVMKTSTSMAIRTEHAPNTDPER